MLPALLPHTKPRPRDVQPSTCFTPTPSKWVFGRAEMHAVTRMHDQRGLESGWRPVHDSVRWDERIGCEIQLGGESLMVYGELGRCFCLYTMYYIILYTHLTRLRCRESEADSCNSHRDVPSLSLQWQATQPHAHNIIHRCRACCMAAGVSSSSVVVVCMRRAPW